MEYEVHDPSGQELGKLSYNPSRMKNQQQNSELIVTAAYLGVGKIDMLAKHALAVKEETKLAFRAESVRLVENAL